MSGWKSTEFGVWPNRDPIGELGGLNLYGYVGNDPGNQVDPLGLVILYANHPVITGPWDHSKLIIIPDDQAYWADHALYGHQLETGPNGSLYLTIGAGPVADKLVAALNRPTDVWGKRCNEQELALPWWFANENEAIKKLLELNAYYEAHGDILYTLFPESGKPQYNSNSYTYSLLTHAGYDLHGFNTFALTPGWGNLIPAEGNFVPLVINLP